MGIEMLGVAIAMFVAGLAIGAIAACRAITRDTLRRLLDAINNEYPKPQALELHQLILRALDGEAKRLARDLQGTE